MVNQKFKNFEKLKFCLIKLIESHILFRLKILICELLVSQKKAKITIKIKYSLVFFSLFISAISWSALFLFYKLSKLDGWSNY